MTDEISCSTGKRLEKALEDGWMDVSRHPALITRSSAISPRELILCHITERV